MLLQCVSQSFARAGLPSNAPLLAAQIVKQLRHQADLHKGDLQLRSKIEPWLFS